MLGHSFLTFRSRISAIFGVSFCLLGWAGAEDSVTLDLPIKAAPGSLPAQFGEVPRQVATPDGQGYTEISLLPDANNQDLLVTVVFDENGGGGPSLSWMSATGQTMLSSDLSEGVTGPNQRTVRVPGEVSSQPGRLIVFGDQGKIHRVRLDWAAQRQVLAAADQRPVSFIVSDRLVQNTELTGRRTLSPPDAWLGKVFEAFLQEDTVKLDEPVGFGLNLADEAGGAVLTVKILGLPLNESLEVWVNDHKAGQLLPPVPALTDAGYVTDRGGKAAYAGWRMGTLFLPGGLLRRGENAITLIPPGGEIYIRDAALQLREPEKLAEKEAGPAVIGVNPDDAMQSDLSSIP